MSPSVASAAASSVRARTDGAVSPGGPGGGGAWAQAFGAIREALAAVDASRRAVPDGLSPTAETYLEGAFGSLVHAREVLRRAVERDPGPSWTERVPMAGIVQRGDAGARLSHTCADEGVAMPGRPDLGADLVRSEEVAALAVGGGFSALLAGALAEHRWLHLATATSWTASWPAADALVRAVNGGRDVVRLDAVAMRGTVDEGVARALAGIGWRRISSPALPDSV